LRLYLNEAQALAEIPVLRLLATPVAELRQRAERLAERLRGVDGLSGVTVSDDVAYVGGGSLPNQQMKTCVVEITARQLSDTDLAYRLRMATPAVMGRLRDGKLVLDVRTILAEQEAEVVEIVAKITG
jgi:L-seryl-tRNA(Ser) seleniumtransferase